MKRAERTATNGCPALNTTSTLIDIMPFRTVPERPFSGKDLSGLKFGRLTVLTFDHFVRYDAVRGGGKWIVSQRSPSWKCRCECGVVTTVQGHALTSGKTISCGCFYIESRHTCNLTHGQSKTPLYRRWTGMITRCTNPNRDFWDGYGGRGIKVCERWKSFENFKSDMAGTFQPGLLLGRKDNDGPYCKANCRWETPLQQANNTRANKMLKFRGRTQTVAQWCAEIGLNPFTVYDRLRTGRSAEEALSKSKLKRRKQ